MGQTDLKMVLTPFVLKPKKTFIFQLNFFKKCTFDNYTVYILHSNYKYITCFSGLYSQYVKLHNSDKNYPPL